MFVFDFVSSIYLLVNCYELSGNSEPSGSFNTSYFTAKTQRSFYNYIQNHYNYDAWILFHYICRCKVKCN